jgi:Carboxypeptidase regulatory-like domain
VRVRLSVAIAIVASLLTATAGAQSIRGTVIDSLSGKPVRAARIDVQGTTLQSVTDSLGRFALTEVPAGERTVTIHTPSLDSLNASYSVSVTVAGATTIAVRVPSALQIAAAACGDRGYGSGGIVLGRIKIAGDSAASLAATVSGDWGSSDPQAPRWAAVTADARGRFALCGVPLDVALTLRAASDAASGQATLRVPAAARFARVELLLHSGVVTTATLIGVVTDSTNRPIGGAEVSVPEFAKTTLTNEEGSFALHDIPPGEQHVVIRRIGYGPVETKLTFQAGHTLQRAIALSRAVTLDSMTVTEKAHDAALGDFDDNRRLGLGHFITREELSKLEGVSTASVLRSIPGISVATRGPYGWIGSHRAQMTKSLTRFGGLSLDRGDSVKGAPSPQSMCYSLVYVDNLAVFSGKNFNGQLEPLFDINTIPVSEIESIEYYASVSQLPAKYLTLHSECGVLVIHTRRFHKDTTSTQTKPSGSEPSR